MFEHISHPVLPHREFVSRQLRALLLGLILIAASLAIGMLGYRWFFPQMDWADAFVNAAMILSGMGPLAQPATSSAKIFSGCYALYSGLMLVMCAGVVFAPLVHRFLHTLHADEADLREQSARNKRTKT